MLAKAFVLDPSVAHSIVNAIEAKEGKEVDLERLVL